MTCIVALEHGEKIYMGGDSAGVADYNLQCVKQPKVFIVGEFIIGYTSSFRMGQLLEYNLSVPRNTEDNDLRYLITAFIPAVRSCLKEGGYTRVDNNQEEGGTFLVGYRGKSYKVDSDFQITQHIDKFVTVGAGGVFALGALAAMDITDPKKSVLKALKIAGDFSAAVRGPYYVLSK